MEHCLSCHSTLKREEKECWACGTPVLDKDPKKDMSDHFVTALGILFWLFSAISVASLVLGLGFFKKSAAATAILRLVQSSAKMMSEAKKKV